MTRFWLIRHGEPVAEARGRCYGLRDFALSDHGRRQMEQVAEYLRNEPITAVFSSPLSRSLEGARIISSRLSRPVKVREDLTEMNFGDFEGLPYDEIAARYPDTYRQWMETPSEVQFPNGESLSDMRVRVLGAFAEIRRECKGETVAIVSHGGVNRILIAWALQMPDSGLFRLGQDYAGINLLETADEQISLRLMNHVPAEV
jgi:alpha-ribazole phosphatase/probable phosphoglycerate mutase